MYKVMDPNADSPKTPPLNLVEYKELQETNASQDEAFAALSFLIEENNSELQSNMEELSQKHDNDIEELSQKHDEDINELSEDINALKGIIDNDVQEKLNVIETDLDNTIEHLASTMSDLTSLEDRVAELPTVSLVNKKIQTETACFRGYFIDWDDVPDDDSEYKNDPYSNKEPNNNDYMVVGDYNNDGCWRFKYTGDWKLQGKDGWEPEYKVSDKPLTQDQIAVLDSGVTSIWKEKIENDIDGLKNNIDELEEDLSNTIAESNAALIMKHDNDINNAEDMIKSQKIKSYKEYYAITQNATAPIPGIPGTMHTVEWNFQNAATDLESIQYTTGNVIGNDSNYCLEVDAINGKFEQRSTDAQFNAGTIIRVPIGGSSSSIKVVSYPGYYHFTIGGIAANSNVTNHICSLDEIKQGFVEIVATNTAYLYSIESTFVEIGFIENSIIPTELYPYLWHYTEIELMNGELFKTNVTLIGTNLKHGSAIVEIDNALDKESTNPVQNKVVTEAIDMITLKNTKIIRTQAEFEAWQSYVRNGGSDKTYEHVFIEAGTYIISNVNKCIDCSIIGTKTIDSNGAVFTCLDEDNNIQYNPPEAVFQEVTASSNMSTKGLIMYADSINNIRFYKLFGGTENLNCVAFTLFYHCYNINNCIWQDQINSDNTLMGNISFRYFSSCYNISNCTIEIINNNYAFSSYGCWDCDNISYTIIGLMQECGAQYNNNYSRCFNAFFNSNNISHVTVSEAAYYFYGCNNISDTKIKYNNYTKVLLQYKSLYFFSNCNHINDITVIDSKNKSPIKELKLLYNCNYISNIDFGKMTFIFNYSSDDNSLPVSVIESCNYLENIACFIRYRNEKSTSYYTNAKKRFGFYNCSNLSHCDCTIYLDFTSNITQRLYNSLYVIAFCGCKDIVQCGGAAAISKSTVYSEDNNDFIYVTSAFYNCANMNACHALAYNGMYMSIRSLENTKKSIYDPCSLQIFYDDPVSNACVQKCIHVNNCTAYYMMNGGAPSNDEDEAYRYNLGAFAYCYDIMHCLGRVSKDLYDRHGVTSNMDVIVAESFDPDSYIWVYRVIPFFHKCKKPDGDELYNNPDGSYDEAFCSSSYFEDSWQFT